MQFILSLFLFMTQTPLLLLSCSLCLFSFLLLLPLLVDLFVLLLPLLLVRVMLVHVEGEVALGGEGQRAVLAGEGAAVKSHKGMVSYEAVEPCHCIADAPTLPTT